MSLIDMFDLAVVGTEFRKELNRLTNRRDRVDATRTGDLRLNPRLESEEFDSPTDQLILVVIQPTMCIIRRVFSLRGFWTRRMRLSSFRCTSFTMLLRRSEAKENSRSTSGI